MELENFHDLSTYGTDVNAGFQFEFYCTGCGRKWKSPFKPYRMGQITGFLSRFGFLFGSAQTGSLLTGGAADFGARKAKEEAREEAMAQAMRLYSNCKGCSQGFCEDCLDSNQFCEKCRTKSGQGVSAAGGAQSGGHACPNCGAAGSGGRFCAECGFDMASTHKSCPACGATAERSARFCGDCGHGF